MGAAASWLLNQFLHVTAKHDAALLDVILDKLAHGCTKELRHVIVLKLTTG